MTIAVDLGRKATKQAKNYAYSFGTLLQDPWPCIQLLQSAMLHARETLPLTKINLQRNDKAMIRQICSIKPEDVTMVRSSKLLAKLDHENLNLILRKRRLHWFGHVEGSSGAIRTACDIQLNGRRGGGGGGVGGQGGPS